MGEDDSRAPSLFDGLALSMEKLQHEKVLCLEGYKIIDVLKWQMMQDMRYYPGLPAETTGTG
ncbi:MAG: hypothetical protein LBD40_00240 [Puniceicoccales bacterium]|nr:hypothetical protein [Puniceicoccales bacterium]